jgi:hypothetical protein
MNHSRQSRIQNRLSANLSVAALAKREASATTGESSYLRAYKALLQLSRILYKSGLFMQNKAKVKIGKMNLKLVDTKDYDNEQQTTNNEGYLKQTQTKPISKIKANGRTDATRPQITSDGALLLFFGDCLAGAKTYKRNNNQSGPGNKQHYSSAGFATAGKPCGHHRLSRPLVRVCCQDSASDGQLLGCRSWVNGICVCRSGAECSRGDALKKIGVFFQVLQQYIVVNVQRFEPLQGLLCCFQELPVSVVPNQILREYGAAERYCTDAEKDEEQNCLDDVLLLQFGASSLVFRISLHARVPSRLGAGPGMDGSGHKVRAGVPCGRAKALMYSQQLIVFADSVCSAQRAGLYLADARGNSQVGDGGILGFAASVAYDSRPAGLAGHIDCLERFRQSAYLIELYEYRVSAVELNALGQTFGVGYE